MSFSTYSRPLTPLPTSLPVLRFEAVPPGSECNRDGCTRPPRISLPDSPVLRFSSRLVEQPGCTWAPVFDVSEIPPVGIRRRPDQVCPAKNGLPDSGSGRENGDRGGCRRHRPRAMSGGLVTVSIISQPPKPAPAASTAFSSAIPREGGPDAAQGNPSRIARRDHLGIASILAQGHLRTRRGRHLDSAVSGNRPYVAQAQESEAVTEKRLDSSGRRSLHAGTS